MQLLSKSSFMHFLDCPIRLWIEKTHPDLIPPISPSLQRIFDQGNEVDELAKHLYPDGVEIRGYNLEGHQNTLKAIAVGAKVLIQPTLVADGLSAKGDFLVKGKFDAWDIYEEKGTTEVKSEHYKDVAFQKICYARAGITIGRTNLIHLNNKYIRKGDIDVEKLFITEDITDDVNDLLPEIETRILEAKEIFNWKKELTTEQFLTCPDLKKKQCEYAGLWLNSLDKKKLESFLGDLPQEIVTKLIENEKFDISRLSKKFLSSIPWKAPASRWPKHINQAAIHEDLQHLKYPLYFFDYETVNPALPPFDGLRPYQMTPFQFSLYIVDSPGATPTTHDFLMDRFEDPRSNLIDSLREWVGPTGSFISWNAPFEQGKNEDMAQAFPQHANFLRGINKRMFDLMVIFRKKWYVEPEFRGGWSIKTVMPVLVPDLSYKNLNIQEGGEASASWYILTDPKTPEDQRKQLYDDMIEYCRLDVFGMVKILEHLQKISR